MKSYLLPYKFKRIGMWMFIPFCVICLWVLLSGELEFEYLKWPCISLCFMNIFDDKCQWLSIQYTDPTNEIGMLGLLVSMCFIALSKEKDEDEMTGQIRMQSFVWSFWVSAAILAFCILFVYGILFVEFTFAAIFLVFLIYILKFNASMHAVRRNVK